jgi:hypothetical protein
MADVNVQRVDRGSPERVETTINRAAGPVATAPGFHYTPTPSTRTARPSTVHRPPRSTSEGLPLPTSELCKQAKPGGRSAAHGQ